MKALPIVPDGCVLTPAGVEAQRARGDALRASVKSVEHSPGELRVHFEPGADDLLIEELVAAEQSCCSFLELVYDDGVMHVASSERPDVVAMFAGFFSEEGT